MSLSRLAIPGYAHKAMAGAHVLALETDLAFVAQAIDWAGGLHAYAARNSEAEKVQGRSTAFIIPAPDSGRWLVRHLTHGGFVSAITGDRFMRHGTPRPFNELRISVELRELGVRTPEVPAAVVYPFGPFYRGDIARRWIGDARDLASCLFAEPDLSKHQRADVLEAAGRLVRRLDDLGVGHPDLNARNILIEWSDESPRAHVIDLEKCRIDPQLPGWKRRRMFKRLTGSLYKFQNLTGRPLTGAERDILRLTYADGPGEP